MRIYTINWTEPQSALYALNELPITIDQSISKHVWNETIELAERYNLSLYDACYLELSLRLGLFSYF